MRQESNTDEHLLHTGQEFQREMATVMEFLLQLCDLVLQALKVVSIRFETSAGYVLSTPVTDGTETRWQTGLGFECSYLHSGLSMVPASLGTEP